MWQQRSRTQPASLFTNSAAEIQDEILRRYPAQSVGTGDTKKKAKEIADLDARINQLLKQATDLQHEKERVADAAGIPTRRLGTSPSGIPPQITVNSPFWRNAEFSKTVGLTADQQKKMEDVFQQNRAKLIDLNAALAKEDFVLNSLMADLRPDEELRVLGQIDRVAEVRTELERTNARMLLGLRQALLRSNGTSCRGRSHRRKVENEGDTAYALKHKPILRLSDFAILNLDSSEIKAGWLRE